MIKQRLVIGVVTCACLASVATSSARPRGEPSVGAEPVSADAGGLGSIGSIGTSGARWCADDAPAVPSSAPEAIVRGFDALARMDEAALRAHVQPHLQARLERAMSLSSASAPLYSDVPLDPITNAPSEVRALLREASACPTPLAYVTEELRIDFPPAFDDTRAENAAEIDATHTELYAGTSVTAYCGACGMAAFVIENPIDPARGIVVLAWDDLRGGIAPNQ